MTEHNTPILLGYKGMIHLHPGDELLYKVHSVAHFSKAVVTQEPGTTGIHLRLQEDHTGESFTYVRGEEIIAGAEELYWPRDKPAAHLLEGLLRES